MFVIPRLAPITRNTIRECVPRPSRDILPRCTKPPARAGQQTFLLFCFRILVQLAEIKFRRAEECCDEDDQKHGQERELRPEIERPKEWEVERDAIEESGHNAGCTNVACAVDS